MSERRLIDPSEIREGDKVRFEVADTDIAYEWRQNGHPRSEHRIGTYYLLDRPTPPVELPETPTLGWLTVHGQTLPGLWARHQYKSILEGRSTETAIQWERDFPMADITAFAPATAVPTEALDELRQSLASVKESGERREDIGNFLAAVDEANG